MHYSCIYSILCSQEIEQQDYGWMIFLHEDMLQYMKNKTSALKHAQTMS